jgi:hypothetical protein
MLERKRFREVCRVGGITYWRHKDGRTVMVGEDEKGMPTIVKLEKDW